MKLDMEEQISWEEEVRPSSRIVFRENCLLER